MPPAIIKVYKNKGQTPLSCIDELKKSHTGWVSIPMTYAGRLDPLASGILLILTGDECMKKEEYTSLPKEYELTILFGFATDTYDVLGKLTDASSVSSFSGPRVGSPDTKKELPDFALVQNALTNFTGTLTQSYPPYSSRTVDGKPLFKWAREDRLNEITIPTHEVLIEKIEIIKNEIISKENLKEKIHTDIATVSGDFRQEEILARWDEILEKSTQIVFDTITLRVSCGSGAYMRTLAYDIGKSLRVPALALEIVRTKVGEYTLVD